MKVAIISDTHDHVENTKKVLEALKQKKVKKILHAGDHVSPFMFPLYKDFDLITVFGNNDADVYRILQNSKDSTVKPDTHTETIKGKKIIMYHGTSEELLNGLIKSQEYDLVIHGHTHKKRQEKIGNTLVINPGSVHGFDESGFYVICDFPSLSVEFFRI